jgi:DNA-binding NarL/FixJ family response regulator
MEIVDVAASAEEGVQSFMKHRPDVIFMDIDLPLAAGVGAIRRILEIEPLACVLGLSTYEEDETRSQALRAGAWCCLTKDRLTRDLISLVRSFHHSSDSRPPSA